MDYQMYESSDVINLMDIMNAFDVDALDLMKVGVSSSVQQPSDNQGNSSPLAEEQNIDFKVGPNDFV